MSAEPPQLPLNLTEWEIRQETPTDEGWWLIATCPSFIFARRRVPGRVRFAEAMAYVSELAKTQREGVVLNLSEEDRQMMLLALAHVSVERPGWDYALNEIAKRMDNVTDGRGVMYDSFRETARVSVHARLASLLREAVESRAKCQHNDPIPGLDEMALGSPERIEALRIGGRRCERFARFAVGTEYPETTELYCEVHVSEESSNPSGAPVPLDEKHWLDRALGALEEAEKK